MRMDVQKNKQLFRTCHKQLWTVPEPPGSGLSAGCRDSSQHEQRIPGAETSLPGYKVLHLRRLGTQPGPGRSAQRLN